MVTVVFTPAYEVFLSRRCAFSCDYCNFPNTPSPLPPSPKTFRSYLRTAQRLEAWQVTLTAGEGIDQMPEILSAMRYYGFRSWYDYLFELCRLTLEAKGRQPLTPVLDVGAIPTRELKKLQPVVPLVRLLLDTVDPVAGAIVHAKAPQKNPILRTLALKDVGKAGIPLVTGIRIGIGESPESWLEAVRIANEVQDQYQNVAAFHVLPFVPQQYSVMADAPPVTNETYQQAVRSIRAHLDRSIALVAEVHHRMALAPESVISGAFDFGPIRIADNERFDVDMLNAVNGVGELLSRINVEMECVPALRESYVRDHRLPRSVEENLERFKHINDGCLSDDEGQPEQPEPQGPVSAESA